MEWLLVGAIAVANNLDNTGVGIAYGLAGIRLRPPINLWISIITFAITAAAGIAGHQVAHLLVASLAKGLSALILCGAGLLVLFPAWLNRKQGGVPDPLTNASTREPMEIGFGAGTLLGVALSINNVAGGFSAGLAHLSVLWTALASAVLSYLVLWFGNWSGARLGATRLGQYAQLAAGALLLLIGVYQLF